MPVVPAGPQQADPTSPMLEKPSPTNLLMALATMKDLGRIPTEQASNAYKGTRRATGKV